ncbi:MAG: FAD:protein FMN transferase [Thermoanaerobaculia bacterium]
MLPLLLALLVGAQAPPVAAPSTPAAPIRQSVQAFGKPAEIEVRGLPPEEARGALQKAFAEIAEIERLTSGAALAALNATAGKGPRTIDPRLLAVLTRAGGFCVWSEGAHGPLGRDLYALWGLRAPVEDTPSAEQIQQAMGLAACDRLTLESPPGSVALAAGSGLDLYGFAEGAAVDRAVEVLRQQKVDNGFVRIGPVERGFGPGPQGKGWPVAMPRLPGQEEHADQIYLRDRALAAASQTDRPLQGGPWSYLNQRTGQPAPGVLATVAVAELAMDAQGLAIAMLVMGPREGQLRIGTLRPRPALLWYLGTGAGDPLVVDYRWSDVVRK